MDSEGHILLPIPIPIHNKRGKKKKVFPQLLTSAHTTSELNAWQRLGQDSLEATQQPVRAAPLQDNAAADCRGRGTMQEGVTHRAALAEFTWAQAASDQDINSKL